MFANVPVLLGQYRPLDSYLHRLDARAKLAPILLVMILALLTDSFLFYGIILVGLFLSLILSGITFGSLLRSMRPVVWLVILTSFYHLIFSGKGSSALFEIYGWRITSEAVRLAGFYSMRLLIFVSIAFLLTLTSSPSELAEAFSKMLRPLVRLRVPVAELSMVLFMAIRFIPILYDEFNAVRHAQIVRGVDFSGSLLARLRKSTYIVIPVLVAAVQRADDVARAMQARGYHAGRDRTSYLSSHFTARETVFCVGSCMFAGLAFWWVG